MEHSKLKSNKLVILDSKPTEKKILNKIISMIQEVSTTNQLTKTFRYTPWSSHPAVLQLQWSDYSPGNLHWKMYSQEADPFLCEVREN